jgi:hypothetical protein
MGKHLILAGTLLALLAVPAAGIAQDEKEPEPPQWAQWAERASGTSVSCSHGAGALDEQDETDARTAPVDVFSLP